MTNSNSLRKRKNRRFVNIKRVLPNTDNLNNKDLKILLRLFMDTKNKDNPIHNLSDTVLPREIVIALSLGLKFNFNLSPDYNQIKKCYKDAIHKIAWKTFFKLQENETTSNNFDDLTKVIIKVRKSVKTLKHKCPIENALFSHTFLSKSVNNLKKNTKISQNLGNYFKSQLEVFLCKNDIIIKQSDKNAGLVVMRKIDYQKEVKRQLEDINVYIPTTKSHYEREMFCFQDKALYLSKILFKCLKMKTLIPYKHKPSSFYILPKIHKKYDIFPIGRPICSTVNTINRGFAIILDSVLKPLSLCISNLLIDTPHLLFLLNNITLNPNQKYLLIAADITSMYQELPINICKKNCVQFYRHNRHKVEMPFDITESQLIQLLNLALDYSFVEFENELFFQKKGIQMGNNASVSIANITAAVELHNMWSREMTFNGRFIDDIFAIINITNIQNVDEWIDNTFSHNFLKFTIEKSRKCINFLDLNISIDKGNKIQTSLYQKPISKHEYVHFLSNHPKHMLTSLPFSCGLRVIRSCSNEIDKLNKLGELFTKFLGRHYPNKIIETTYEKLINLNRLSIITPKSPFHKLSLSMHFPHLVHQLSTSKNVTNDNSTTIFCIFPFYSNISNYSKLLKRYMIQELCKSKSQLLKKIALDLNIKIAFTIPNPLNKFLNSPPKK